MSFLGNDSTHFHYFFITVAFLIGTKACEVGAKKGRKGGEKQERKTEREKKRKRKGAVLFPSFPNPLFLFPFLPPSLPTFLLRPPTQISELLIYFCFSILEILEKSHLRTGKVSDNDIVAISNELGTKWIWVGRLLGLEETELDDIKENNGSVYECSHTMLLSWTQRSTSQATYEWLAQALRHTAVSKDLIAQKYCIQDIGESQGGITMNNL